MIIDKWKGYWQGADISMIPREYLAYPSRNVLVDKNRVVSRGGLKNDGVSYTVSEPVHSEFVWKDAIGGRRFLRVHGNTVQMKHGDIWVTIFTALDSDTVRVFFASFTDSNTTVIKSRLIFCDGSTNLYSWNGLVATVESFATPTITVEADSASLGLMGADAGDATPQTVTIYSLDGNGEVDAYEEETYSVDVTGGLDIALDSAPSSFVPVEGDLVIAKPVTFADAISSSTEIDAVFSFRNHIVAASYDRVDLHFSDSVDYTLASGLDFVEPASGDRTAVTPIHLYLKSKFTAMQSRKNVLWISDTDDWIKVTKTEEQNAYGYWIDVEDFEGGDLKGALPMAVAKHKGDIIYMAQDNTIQRITTLDVIGKDEILLLSDNVQGMFDELDNTDVRLSYIKDGIFIIFPSESVMVILDTSEREWYFQPPQDIPINCMSVWNGIKYGHHNARNESYELFSGRLDLGYNMAQGCIAPGLQSDGHHFRLKKHAIIGIDCRITDSCKVDWRRRFEEDGARQEGDATFIGLNLKKFSSSEDGSWGAQPYGSLPYGGSDSGDDIYRAFVFDRDRTDGYFEYRPIIYLNGSEDKSGHEFHLLGLFWEDEKTPRNIPKENFLERE